MTQSNVEYRPIEGFARITASEAMGQYGLAVLAMRSSYSGRRGEVATLARKYGISETQVARIVKRTRWQHVS